MNTRKKDARMLAINLVTFSRMFAAFFVGLQVEGITIAPLLVVLYMVLATHVCMVYTCCRDDVISKADAIFVGVVLAVELTFTVYAVLTGGVNILLELIGFGIVQTILTIIYFLVSCPQFSSKLGWGRDRPGALRLVYENGVKVKTVSAGG